MSLSLGYYMLLPIVYFFKMVVFRSLKGYCFRTQPAGDVAAKPDMVSLYSGWFIRFPSLQIMMIPYDPQYLGDMFGEPHTDPVITRNSVLAAAPLLGPARGLAERLYIAEPI